MRKILQQLLKKVFYVVVLIFPLSFIIVNSFLKGSYAGQFVNYYLILLFLLISIIFLFIPFEKIESKKIKLVVIPILILVIALLVKGITVYIFGHGVSQISDFGDVYSHAVGAIDNSFFITKFYHWALMPKILGAFLYLVGYSQFNALIFNVIITSLTSIIVYYIAINILKETKIAILSSLIFIFWPSYLIYTNILTTEHLALFFIGMFMLLYIVGSNRLEEKNHKGIILIFVLSGVCLGMIDFFKPVAIILIIAMLITEILFASNKRVNHNIKTFLVNMKKKKYPKVFLLILLVGTMFVTKQIGYSYIEHFTGMKVNKYANPYYLQVGFNPKGNGLWDPIFSAEYNRLLEENNYDYKKVGQIVMQDLKTDIKKYYKNYPKLIAEKIAYAWSDDLNMKQWYDASVNDVSKIRVPIDKFNKVGPIIMQSFYIFIVIFSFGAAINEFLRPKNKYILMNFLFIFGMSMVLLLGEVQGRYKSVLYLSFSLIVTYGIYNLYLWLKRHMRKSNQI